jgi:hypothetical protein
MGQNNGKQMEYNEVKFEKYTDRDLVAHRLSNFKIIRVDELDPVLHRPERKMRQTLYKK